MFLKGVKRTTSCAGTVTGVSCGGGGTTVLCLTVLFVNLPKLSMTTVSPPSTVLLMAPRIARKLCLSSSLERPLRELARLTILSDVMMFFSFSIVYVVLEIKDVSVLWRSHMANNVYAALVDVDDEAHIAYMPLQIVTFERYKGTTMTAKLPCLP